jgi:outer membrane protein assembly factor BamB
MLFAKVKPNGTLHWAMEYEANQISMGYSVIEKKEGGFLVLGNTNISKTDLEIFIMSIDENGKMLWAKTYGGLKFESAADIVETPDGGFVATGITESFGSGASDVLLFKIDAKGNILWSKTYGGKNEEYPSKIALAKDGIVVVGSSASFNSESFDVLLFKTDWNGNSECLGNNTILNVKNFQPVSEKIEKAEMKKVEQGVTPPNMKKADTQNITEYKREVRTKKICN